MNAHNFIFAKPYSCKMGDIPKGAEVCMINEQIFFNCVPIEPWYYEHFRILMENELKKPNYLREIPFRK